MRVPSNRFFWLIPFLLSGCLENFNAPPAEYSKVYGSSQKEPWAEVSVSSLQTGITGTIHIRLKHSLPRTFAVESYQLHKEHVKGFDINLLEVTDRINGDEIYREYDWQLEPLDTGDFELNFPPLEFIGFNQNGNNSGDNRVIQPDSVMVRVPPKTDQGTALPEIYNLLKPKFKYIYGLYAFISASFAALICFYLLRFYRKRKRSKETTLTAWQHVMQKLQNLEDRIQQDKVTGHEVYVQLNHIFKYYLENHLKIILPGQTVEEGLPEIDTNPQISADNARMIREFCTISDLVKFAGYEPESAISINALKQMKQLISTYNTGNP